MNFSNEHARPRKDGILVLIDNGGNVTARGKIDARRLGRARGHSETAVRQRVRTTPREILIKLDRSLRGIADAGVSTTAANSVRQPFTLRGASNAEFDPPNFKHNQLHPPRY